MTNLIEILGEKLWQCYEWLKDTANTMCDRVQSLYNRYQRYRAKLKEHREYIASVLDSSLDYIPEQVDIELIGRIAVRLKSLEGGELQKYIKSLSFEQRKEYFENTLLPTICKEMNITPEFIGWFQDNCTVGYYSESQCGIALNELFLASDNDFILRMVINAVVHECKHAMQWDAVSGRNTHGYSPDLINKWKLNFNDYISPEESDEGYVKQPVEWDASSFAESAYPTDK